VKWIYESLIFGEIYKLLLLCTKFEVISLGKIQFHKITSQEIKEYAKTLFMK